MKYLYTLPQYLLIFVIFLAVLTILIQVVNASFNVLIKPKKKNKIVNYIYNVSLILYFVILCGAIASVQRHLTEGTIYFNYYIVERYFIIIVTITSLLNVIFNRSYKDIYLYRYMIIRRKMLQHYQLKKH